MFLVHFALFYSSICNMLRGFAFSNNVYQGIFVSIIKAEYLILSYHSGKEERWDSPAELVCDKCLISDLSDRNKI